MWYMLAFELTTLTTLAFFTFNGGNVVIKLLFFAMCFYMLAKGLFMAWKLDRSPGNQHKR